MAHQKETVLERQTGQIMAYLQGLLRHEEGRTLYERYRPALEKATPRQVFQAYHRLYAAGVAVSDLLDILDKSINAFHGALKAGRHTVEPVGLADYLCRENTALLERLQKIRQHLMTPPGSPDGKLLQAVRELADFDGHYLKKENVLFPYLEKKADYFQGLGIMWALHDEIRQRLKNAVACLEDADGTELQRNKALGRLIFGMHGMVLKEELILLPAAQEVLDAEDWQEMLLHCGAFAFPYIPDPPDLAELTRTSKRQLASWAGEALLQTETGSMDLAQIEQVFACLPVDLTFIDAENKVRYFNRPKERVFPRSAAIIGRSVENCHPPQSVGRVLEIITAFRDGRQSQATFWIRPHSRLILIQYFAVRDPAGCYLGTLEVSQDITAWQHLDGERRLLSWNTGSEDFSQ